MTPRRLISIAAACITAGLISAGGLWMLWVLFTPSEAVLRYMGTP
jgi:hypothetical protein